MVWEVPLLPWEQYLLERLERALGRKLDEADVRCVAEAVREDGGTLKVVRNGRTLVMRRPRGKDLADAKELTQVRNFLDRSGP